MSLTSVVPAASPSDLQSSSPFVPSLAAKKSSPPAFASDVGAELALPGRMFLTSFVPVPVPSDFQSSRPCVTPAALKKSLPATFVR